MTTPYSTRSRKNYLLPNASYKLPDHPIIQEMSPHTNHSPSESRLHHSIIEPSQEEKGVQKTSHLSHCKKLTTATILSNAEILNLDPTSSLNNEQSRVNENKQKQPLEGDYVFANFSSIAQDPNSPFATFDAQHKPTNKVLDPFMNEKKSYRNICQHHKIFGVPYRKCHSTMEEKVVSIINKINNGKQCQKEIQTLIDRTHKISTKQMMNHYFISGLHTINKLLSHNQSELCFNQRICSAYQQCLKQLMEKIKQDLDCPTFFSLQHKQPSAPKPPILEEKQIKKRTFGILRKKLRKHSLEEVQQLSLSLATNLLNNNYTFNEFLEELRKV